MTQTTEPQIRALVAERLSRLVKGRDQLSIERQDHQAETYASEGNRVIVATAADAGVSGSVSPFKRPKLGPYLTQPELIGAWDELVASAIDRLGRNARDLYDLRNWCEDNHKRITILSPRLHWPVSEDDLGSRLVWTVLEQLAEIELRQTQKRYAETRAYLREQKSMIGRPCWGFTIVGSKAAKTIKPIPAKKPYLLKMIDMALAGTSRNDIARWLDSEGMIPAALEWWLARPESERGEQPSDKWDPTSVGQILRNESLYGVYRLNGTILLHHDSVIGKERWDKLQAKLDANPKRRGPTRNDPMMLTDILYCANCGRIMHARRIPSRMRKDGTRYEWIGYRCDGTPKKPSTCKHMVRADKIESMLDMMIIATAGDEEITEIVHVPAKGHADEMAEIDLEIDALPKDAPNYLAEVTRLYGEREVLMALGTEAAHREERPTGILLRDYWPTLDAIGKRDHLLRAKAASDLKIYADPQLTNSQLAVPVIVAGDPSRVVGALTTAA